ncbi:MAG: pilus assembly protein PilZ [Desulfobacter postgatei]|uniref:Pilus assembly protein PilZ n=1 Tax=Desulfobacter postgatei TaxID=2293 RepID=A0A2G6MRA2_9BACT|nr:MAG: pilus assembly protein PilZ [Desulfobacter postgatei]
MMIPIVYVTPELTGTFACESCGNFYTKDVSKFVKHKDRVRLKYKCLCGHVFSVMLERRQVIRKEVRLKGVLIQNRKRYPGVITDLSRNGIRFRTLEKAFIKVEYPAEIKFTLDNPNRSEIHRHIKIQEVFSEYSFGCKFDNTEHFDDLGKYFLFHF